MPRVAKILTLLTWLLCLWPSAATACRFQYPCERAIAPAHGSVVPANAPFFVAGSLETFGRNADGGLMASTLSLGRVSLFEAGELISGESLTLHGTDCDGADAGSTVLIGAEQPFPTRVGRVHFTEVARNWPLDGCFDGPETISYEVGVEPAPFVEPWLPLTRFEVFPMPRDPSALFFNTIPFGRTQLTSQGELSLGTVTRVCSTDSILVRVVLEVAGRPPVETAEQLELRCVPRGCSMTGTPPLLLVLALWWRRRATPSATRAARPCRP